MNKKEIAEIKKRFKKEGCTFTRMCGCYVDSERNRVVKLDETFLNLDEEEFFKYLEIAKKTLSGTIGNNLLELPFPMEEEAPGGRQQFLMALRSSSLLQEELLERFYDLVIDNYEYAGNYLILIFHDAYDVITKTSDNNKIDESEEVYEYLIGAVCPVSLSKPGLGYRADQNRIGPRVRDWVVGMPESGFIFPAFTDRSADIHAVMTYHKNAKEPHAEFMENILGCTARRTATEQKMAFASIVKKALGGDEDASREVFYHIQEGLSDMAQETGEEEPEEQARLTPKQIGEIMAQSDVPENAAAMIEHSYEKEFEDEVPFLENLIDEKAVEAAGKLRQNKELVQKVASLQQQLEDTRMLIPDPKPEDAPTGDIKTYDVILRVKPEKASQIKSQVIGGQKCLVIPLEEDEHAAINGVNTKV